MVSSKANGSNHKGQTNRTGNGWPDAKDQINQYEDKRRTESVAQGSLANHYRAKLLKKLRDSWMP